MCCKDTTITRLGGYEGRRESSMKKRMNIFEGMRMGQRLVWTRTELAKFQELEDLYNKRLFAKGPEFEVINKKIDIADKNLRELMGNRRFRLLIGSDATLRAWRGEIFARYLKKHPEDEPADCMPGWE